MSDSVNSGPINSIPVVPSTSTPKMPTDAPKTPVTQVARSALTSSKPGFADPSSAPPAAKQPPPPPAKKPPPPPPPKKQIGEALLLELKNKNKDVDINIINSFLKTGIERGAMREALCEVLIRILVSFSNSEMALNAGRTDTQTVKAIEETQIKNKEVLNLILNYVKNNDPIVVGQALVSLIWHIRRNSKELYSEKAMQLFFDASDTIGVLIDHDKVIEAFQDAVFVGNEKIIKFLLNKVESHVVADVLQHAAWNLRNPGVFQILTKKIMEVEEESAE